MSAYLMYAYEVLSAWGPHFGTYGLGDVVWFGAPPNEPDGYCLFDGIDGSGDETGFQGRCVGSRELGGELGAALAFLNGLNETEEGRDILQEAHKRWSAKKDEQ